MKPTIGRWILLATSLTQLASVRLASFDQDSFDDPVIVPPGSFFSIWGIVVIACVALAAWGFPMARAQAQPFITAQLWVSLAQVGFTVWLVAADNVEVLTLPVLAVMVAVLAKALWHGVRAKTDRITRVLFALAIGVFGGWTTAALWLNVATLLPSDIPTALTGTIVVLACLTLVAGIVAFDGNLGYVAAGCWALLGVTISAWEPAVGLSVLGIVGLVSLAGATVWAKRGSLSKRPTV